MATLDAVKALCLESPSSGGTQLDTYPTEVDPSQDALTVAGVYLNGPTAKPADKTVLLDRLNGSLRLTDQQATHVLAELVSSVTGQVSSHDALRDLQHFLGDEGPGTGFASGAVQATTFVAGTPLIASEIWYTSSAQTLRIISKAITYIAGTPLVGTVTWSLYSASGAVLRTVVDTANYTGPLVTSVTRTWS